MPRRFGKTRYGHAFSKVRGFGADRGCDPLYDGPAYPDMTIGHTRVPSVSSPPVSPPQDGQPHPSPTALMTLGDLVKRRQALRYGCLACLGMPRQMSPHEAAMRFGLDMRLTEVRAALRARCRSNDCRLEFQADQAPWSPYRVK